MSSAGMVTKGRIMSRSSCSRIADGYSWTEETNASGYTVIWLNGPPPGAEITVTVGGATRFTSD
jgi:hypothetical protein